MRATRLAGAPIIHAGLEGLAGDNINGPSLIQAPQWLSDTETGRLGEYYLYFAHHKGRHIRLAHADRPSGPWTVYEPGTLQLEESHFPATLDEFAPELANRSLLVAIVLHLS